MTEELEFKVEAEDRLPILTVTFEASFNRIDHQQQGNGIHIRRLKVYNPEGDRVLESLLPADTQAFIYEEADRRARIALGR